MNQIKIMQSKITQHSSLFTISALVLISLLPLMIAFRSPTLFNDDSYITLTYAKNLAYGNGFVFNHPPAVFGTTTPLFTMLVAALSVILNQIENIPTIAIFLSTFCLLGIVWTFYCFREEWALKNSHVTILALALVGSAWSGLLGMEAYLFAFLLILSFSTFLKTYYLITGVITGLLFLTRGEGVLVLAVLFIALAVQNVWHQKSIDTKLLQKKFKLLIGFMLPVLPWLIYAQFTFGTFLPNTLSAKQAHAGTSPWNSLLHRLIDQWAPSWGTTLIFEFLPTINFWWVLVATGFIYTLVKKRAWMLIVTWMILYISGYTLLNISPYGWYQIPIAFASNIFFALGIIAVTEILDRYIKPNFLSISLSALFVILIIFKFSSPYVSRFLWHYEGDTRNSSYITLSQWFREHTEPTESIAFIEIGYLGYHTDNRIIDLAGLVLPDIVPHIAEGDYTWGFWHYEPDYYIYSPNFDGFLAGIRSDPRFDRQYQPIVTLPGLGKNDIIIYERINR